MRLFPLLAIGLSLVAAGCFGGDNGGGTTTTTTPAGTTGGTTTSTTTTTPTGTTPTTTTPTTPTKPAPQEIATGTADFTQNTPAQPLAPKAFTVPAGYTMANLTVTFSCTGGAPACVSNGIQVKAAGLTCALTDNPLQGSKTCVQEGAVTPGDYKVEFAGEGLVSGAYKVTIS